VLLGKLLLEFSSAGLIQLTQEVVCLTCMQNYPSSCSLAFGALTQLGIRMSIWPVKKLSDEVLAWLSVRNGGGGRFVDTL